MVRAITSSPLYTGIAILTFEAVEPIECSHFRLEMPKAFGGASGEPVEPLSFDVHDARRRDRLDKLPAATEVVALLLGDLLGEVPGQ